MITIHGQFIVYRKETKHFFSRKFVVLYAPTDPDFISEKLNFFNVFISIHPVFTPRPVSKVFVSCIFFVVVLFFIGLGRVRVGEPSLGVWGHYIFPSSEIACFALSLINNDFRTIYKV